MSRNVGKRRSGLWSNTSLRLACPRHSLCFPCRRAALKSWSPNLVKSQTRSPRMLPMHPRGSFTPRHHIPHPWILTSCLSWAGHSFSRNPPLCHKVLFFFFSLRRAIFSSKSLAFHCWEHLIFIPGKSRSSETRPIGLKALGFLSGWESKMFLILCGEAVSKTETQLASGLGSPECVGKQIDS